MASLVGLCPVTAYLEQFVFVVERVRRDPIVRVLARAVADVVVDELLDCFETAALIGCDVARYFEAGKCRGIREGTCCCCC